VAIGIHEDDRRAARKVEAGAAHETDLVSLSDTRWKASLQRNCNANGVEAAAATLGHSSAKLTDEVYAERDMQRVAEVMRRMG